MSKSSCRITPERGIVLVVRGRRVVLGLRGSKLSVLGIKIDKQIEEVRFRFIKI